MGFFIGARVGGGRSRRLCTRLAAGGLFAGCSIFGDGGGGRAAAAAAGDNIGVIGNRGTAVGRSVWRDGCCRGV